MTGRRTATRRGTLVGLSLFMVVATVLTWLVYVTLRRDVEGPTTAYSALFSDVFGLREGDDVRIAGVRVGRVGDIELDGVHARVSFIVEESQRIPANVVASVTYQNIVGQRYLALEQGTAEPTGQLSAGSEIPVQHTMPSFDVGALLNGYEPLFAVLDPEQVNNLTNAVIGSLQGDTAAITTLVDQTSMLANTFTGKDSALDRVIVSLDSVMGVLAEQGAAFESAITDTHQVVAAFDSRRPALVESIGQMTRVVRNLSKIAGDVEAPIREMLAREPGYTNHMLSVEPQIAYTGRNTPLFLKGLARIFGEGAYMNAYACDVNIYGFFPGLNDVVPIIVDAATPGGEAMHTPKCRKNAHG